MNQDPREQLKLALEAKNLTRKELEDVLGVGNGVVGKWVLGRRTPEHHMRIALQMLFGIPAESWLTEAEQAVIHRAEASLAAQSTSDEAA